MPKNTTQGGALRLGAFAYDAVWGAYGEVLVKNKPFKIFQVDGVLKGVQLCGVSHGSLVLSFCSGNIHFLHLKNESRKLLFCSQGWVLAFSLLRANVLCDPVLVSKCDSYFVSGFVFVSNIKCVHVCASLAFVGRRVISSATA